MSAEENKAFIRRYFEALNGDKSPATLDAWVADEQLKQYIATVEAAFPNYQFTIEDLVVRHRAIDGLGWRRLAKHRGAIALQQSIACALTDH